MLRTLRTTLAAAGALAAFGLASALADGPPETPPLHPQAEKQAVAPAPSQSAVRAGPVQPASADAAPRTGALTLADGAVQLNVPAGYLFYSPAEAQAYLQRASAPAPRGTVLGLLAPAATRPTHQDFWGAVVAYDPVGHVASDGAATLTAPGFADTVRASRSSAQRGFEGFAAQPAFEPAAATLVWAERSAQPAAGVRDLRHEQRLLGRAGVVSYTMLGRSDQMTQMVAAAPTMLQMASFPDGQRYADFNPATDQGSRFDLPGLVTGQENAVAQIAAETGPPASTQNAGLLSGAGLQGAFPWIAGGVVALAALGWFVLGRKPKVDDDDEAHADEGQAPRSA